MFKIRQRYLSSLLANCLKAVTNFLTGIAIARYFGPENYGNLAFLIGTASAIIAFIDLGTSKAFFTFISQKRRSFQFYGYYTVWVCLQAVFFVAVIWVVLPEAWVQRIWIGHGRSEILLSLAAMFSMHRIWQLSCFIGESIRETHKVQLLRIFLAVVHLSFIVSWAFLKLLSIKSYFVILCIENTCFSFILLFWIRKKVVRKNGSKKRIKEALIPYVTYCGPLILISVLDFFEPFFMRWLLQFYGGSVQQGYFSISERLSTIVSLISVSAANILWKEMSAANADNTSYEYKIFKNSTKILFAVCVVLCCAFLPYANEIIALTVGEQYLGARSAFIVMLLVPAFASVDMVAKTYFLATERVRAFRNVWFIKSGCSILFGYFLVASPTALIPGLGLSSFGMSLRLFLATILGVFLYLFLISKVRKWKIDYGYLLYFFPLVYALAWVVKLACREFVAFIGVGDMLFGILFGIGVYFVALSLFSKVLFQMLGLADEWTRMRSYQQSIFNKCCRIIRAKL